MAVIESCLVAIDGTLPKSLAGSDTLISPSCRQAIDLEIFRSPLVGFPVTDAQPLPGTPVAGTVVAHHPLGARITGRIQGTMPNGQIHVTLRLSEQA